MINIKDGNNPLEMVGLTIEDVENMDNITIDMESDEVRKATLAAYMTLMTQFDAKTLAFLMTTITELTGVKIKGMTDYVSYIDKSMTNKQLIKYVGVCIQTFGGMK